MGLFPGFGGWINQNIQQPLKTSKRSKNGKSSSVSDEDRYIQGPWYWDPDLTPKEKAESLELDHVKSMPLFTTDPRYYDLDELVRQDSLWNSEYKKHPWNDAPAKVKTTSKRSKNGKSSSVSEEDRYIQGPWYWDPDLTPKEKAESLEIDHVRSMPLLATDPKYYDLKELARQNDLWNSEYKKHPWNDAPAKVKVKTKNGICHLNIDFTLGSPPQAVFELFTDPRNMGSFHSMGKYKNNWRTRLDTLATKVLNKDGPRQITEVEKVLRWKILGYNGTIPIHLIIDENHKKVTATYKKVKVMHMKVFEGSWKIEPLYVDQKRLCKSRSPISEEEYKKCSGSKGRIGSKVTMEHIFQPSSLLNVPPVSWFIRGIAVKVTKALLQDLREHVITMNKMETVDPLVYAKVVEEVKKKMEAEKESELKESEY